MELDAVLIAVVTPLVVAVVQAAKEARMDSRFAPLTALASGTILGLTLTAAGMGNGNLAQGAVAGLVAGASAAGLWSGTKTIARR